MADSNEVWKPVAGYEGLYEVSDHGRVRSVDREVTRERGGRTEVARRRGRILKPEVQHHGHLRVALSRGGVRREVQVHRLVLEAFVGPAPADKPNGLHWDDDPANNYVGNLRWGAQTDNLADMIRNSGHYNVKKTHCPAGHPYDEENTRYRRGQQRVCRACGRDYYLRRGKALRQAQAGNGEGRAAA